MMPDILKALRRRVVEIDHLFKHRHLPSSLGCLGIIADIYDKLGADDVFLLSKGHSAAAWYAVLEAKGFHPDVTKVHPERDIANGVTNTGGSLGHGLPMAVGIARAKKLSNNPGMVHVLMGDGECQEGTTWESVNLAHNWALNNLHIWVDVNHCGALGRLPYDVAGKLTFICVHPKLHLCATIKGLGVSFLTGTTDHVRVLTDAEYKQAMEELT